MTYLKTDDREIERVDAVCNHRRCPVGECQAYTAATLEPSAADHELAAKLVADEWRSISSKHRHVMRWKVPPPSAEDILRQEMLDTPAGKKLASYYEHYVRYDFGSLRLQYAEGVEGRDQVEYATLSPSLFRAFKKAGGRCA